MITFLLARIGYGGNSALFGSTVDEIWLGYLTVGGWLIIIPAIIVGIVLEEPMSWKLVSRNRIEEIKMCHLHTSLFTKENIKYWILACHISWYS